MDEDILQIREEIKNVAKAMEDYLMTQLASIELSALDQDKCFYFFCTSCCNEWTSRTLRSVVDPTNPLSDPIPIQCSCGSRSLLYKRPSSEDRAMLESVYSDEDDGGEGVNIWEEVSLNKDGSTSISGYILPKNVSFIHRNVMDYLEHKVELVDGEAMEMDEYFLYRDLGC